MSYYAHKFMQQQLFRIFDTNKYLILALIILSNILVLYVTNEHLKTVEIAYNTVSDTATMEDVSQAFTQKAKGNWMGYVATPLFLLIKLLVISFGINILMLLLNIKLSFKKILGVVIVAELIVVLSSVARVIWLYYFTDVQTLNDLDFVPLSLYNFLGGSENLPALAQYPLRFINLFEVAYWIFLALGLGWVLNEKFGKSLGLVARSYGVGLLIFLAVVTMGMDIYQSTTSEDKFAEARQHPPQEIIDLIGETQPEENT